MDRQDLIDRAVRDCEEVMSTVPRYCDNGFKSRCNLASITSELSAIPSVMTLSEAMQTMSETDRSILLCNDPSVWLLGWKMGDASTIHDHANSVAGVRILRGVITERLFVFDWATDTHNGVPFRAFESVRDFHAGSVISIPTPYIHQFTTGVDGITVSLHVYSPRLSTQAYFTKVSDQTLRYVSSDTF